MIKETGNYDVVIFGAGLAGLTAGYELAKAGKKVLVVEKLDGVGGLARTLKVGNFRFDTGPHRWYTKNDMVNNWMLKILEKETIKVPRLTRIYFDRKFFYYPIRLVNAMKGMGFLNSLKSLLDFFLARIKHHLVNKKPLTIEEGYIDQFGKTLYETFFKRYTEKLWGCPCSEISADWLGQRSRGFTITTIIKDALFKSKKIVSFVDEFSYPKNGIGRLAEKLAEGILKANGKIMLNSQIVHVSQKNRLVTQVNISTGRKIIPVTAREYISSIPLNELILMLSPKPPPEIISSNSKLKYRDEIQVALFIKKTQITPDTWIYVHPLNLPYVRFMEMDNWSKVLSPPGTTTIVFEIACNEGDKLWREKDKNLIDLVKKSYIEEFNFITQAQILGGYVYRSPKEYPVYHLGYQQDLTVLKDYLKNLTNLQIIGRNGTFRYNNMDHSVEMGLYAALNIMTEERKFDIDSVNIEREYLEEKKIEMGEDEKVESEK